MAKKPEKPEKEYIDIFQMELDQNLPNWLSDYKPKPAKPPTPEWDDKRKQNQIAHSNEIQGKPKKGKG